MSIEEKLNWVVATKPGEPKATEHSGPKKGKGSWDKKKVVKKTSNKARRAADKQAAMGEENDGPFPGAAPMFTKASELNWGQDQALSEPRPCYPSEEPVEDHCNPNISPDDNDNDSYVDDEYSEDRENWGDQGFEVIDPGADPMEEGGDPFGEEEWSPDRWSQEIDEDTPQTPQNEQPTEEKDTRRNAPVPRDPSLAPNEPHQFWNQGEDYIQEILPMVMERAKKGDQEAQRLIQEGPRVGRYEKKSLFDTMQDPGFWNKKGTQEYKKQIEKEEGLKPESLGPMGEDELQKIRDLHYSDDKPENTV